MHFTTHGQGHMHSAHTRTHTHIPIFNLHFEIDGGNRVTATKNNNISKYHEILEKFSVMIFVDLLLRLYFFFNRNFLSKTVKNSLKCIVRISVVYYRIRQALK